MKGRTFETGATRDTIEGKPQYEGYLSPLVLREFGQYMLEHSKHPNGTPRPPDNWQKGIPTSTYMDSMLRHLMNIWLHHRGFTELATEPMRDALCGLFFNVQGYTHEYLKVKYFEELYPAGKR